MPKMITDFGYYQSVCIGNDLFGGGTNTQFDKVYRMMKNGGISMNDLTLITWLCSCNRTYDEVKGILRKAFYGRT
jgi:hypothetical protein